MNWSDIFPITDTIWASFLILSIIMVVPSLMSRIRFPQIAGLIITGLLVGENGLGLIDNQGHIQFFSRVGLLFIMFFAGLETDIEEMRKTKVWGLLFGFLTFTVPFVLCLAVCSWLFGFSRQMSLVIGCIMGSHTLISFPIISHKGLSTLKSVAISLTGALMAILLALTVFAYVQAEFKGSGGFNPLLLLLKIALYAFVIIFFYPRMARTFFKRVNNSFSHCLFVLILLFLSTGLASIIGLEGILGAFLAGLVLGRYIPGTSPLMVRLDFIGNTFLIPIFLLYTGMLTDVRNLHGNLTILYLSGALLLAGTFAKWLPAFIIQKSTRLSRNDRMIMFGLSESHAAGALAIAMGGYNLGIVDGPAISAIILVVLFSCLFSNFITERGADSIVRCGTSGGSLYSTPERQLVCLSGGTTMQPMMDTAIALRLPHSKIETVGLHITVDGEHVPKYISEGRQILSDASAIAASADMPFITQNRVGTSIPASILHAADEYTATDIIVGLPPKQDLTGIFYENFLTTLTSATNRQLIFLRLTVPLSMTRRITVLVQDINIAQCRLDKSLDVIRRLGTQIGCHVELFGKPDLMDYAKDQGKFFNSSLAKCSPINDPEDIKLILGNLSDDHLFVTIRNRETITSQQEATLVSIYKSLPAIKPDCGIMLLYPETADIELKPVPSARTERDMLKLLRI